ncbi:DNA repair-scaffolding protein-like [Biomphalaria glabrata]|uniref:DNA repair-scaffolding protein-like n=1 Tax=Biomphalaria glabrata TaxID=6526 RepID=A0A9W3AY40_BIOGL|nr:DNA repair-scaffolding protein-like [Biomphalaria glabrata]
MTHSAWQHCKDGFVGVDKYQWLMQDSSTTSNKQEDNNAIETQIEIKTVKTPDRPCKVSKRKRSRFHVQTRNIHKNIYATNHEEFHQTHLVPQFQVDNQSDCPLVNDIEWSSSSSDEDKATNVISKKKINDKRRCVSHSQFNSSKSKDLHSFDSIKIDLIATPSTDSNQRAIANLSDICNEENKVSQFNQHFESKTQDFESSLGLLHHDSPISKHKEFIAGRVRKRKPKICFQHKPKVDLELMGTISDVSSGSDYDSEKNVQLDIDHSKRKKCVEHLSDTESAKIDPTGISSSSSPQAETIRASDWILAGQKQKTPVKIDPLDTVQGQDSTKKKKKYPKDTLAGRLCQLINWEKSSVRFWYHSVGAGIADVTKKKSTTLKILKLVNEVSVYLGHCLVIATQELCQAIFSKQTVEKLILKPGVIVSIFPPWQELNESDGTKTILCTNYVNVISSLEQTEISDICEEMNNRLTLHLKWSCPCTAELSMSCTVCPASKHPVIPNLQIMEASACCPSVRLHSVLDSLFGSQSKRTLLESIERTESEWACLPSFEAKVLRLLRQTEIKTKTLRHQLLLEDAAGTMMLVTVPDNYSALENLYKIERKLCTFQGLCLVSRTNKDKQPDLFSLIDLVWTQVAPHSSDQSQSKQSVMSVSRSPNFAYLLATPVGRDFTFRVNRPCEDFENLKLVRLRDIQKLTRNSRISFLAKIIAGGMKPGCIHKVYVFDDFVNNDTTTLLFLEVSPGCVLDRTLSIALFRDVWYEHGMLTADNMTTILSSTSCQSWNINIHSSEWERVNQSALHLPKVSSDSLPGSLVTVQGTITSVDDSNAYSWDECDFCASDRLVTLSDTGSIWCKECNRKVELPVVKMKMEVFIQAGNLNATVKIDLSQRTIQSLLPRQIDEEGYDLGQVINQQVNCPVCLVQEPKPDSQMKQAKLSLLELNYF